MAFMSLDLIGNAYNFVSIPKCNLARTLSKSAHRFADMNRNTTHHAVALTESVVLR